MRRTALTAAITVVLSLGVAGPVYAAETTTLSHKQTASETFAGERVYFAGHVKLDGNGVADQEVVAQERPAGSSTWRTIKVLRTAETGHYRYSDTPSSDTEYRVVARESARIERTVGETLTVDTGLKGDRTLAARTAQVARYMGDKVGEQKSADGKVWQTYELGVLIKVNRPASLGDRVWMITGAMYDKWTSLGGLNSKLGHPVGDVECQLLDDGCLQRFAGGSLYDSDDAKMTVLYGSGVWTELGVVAKSQVGYTEPGWRDNKFNDWIGANNAWCGVFQGWIAEASGNPGLVPKTALYSQLVTAAKANMTIVTKPRPGDIAFLDFVHSAGNASTPTHAAFIREVRGSTLYTYEGNTTDGSGDQTRGVWSRTRSTGLVVFYARPDY